MRQSFEWRDTTKLVHSPFTKSSMSRTSCHCSSSARPCKRPVCYSVAKASSCHKLGRELVAQGQQGSLQATLFHIACWRLTFRISAGASRFLAAVDMGVVSGRSRRRRPIGDAGKLSRCARSEQQFSKIQVGPRRHRVRGANLATLVWFGLLDRRTESDPGPVLSETYLYESHRSSTVSSNSMSR